MGLLTTYELIERGYTNLTIIAESFENLTSHKAGGLLAQSTMSNDSDVQKLINSLSMESYKFYKDIAEYKHPNFKKGARFVPSYFEARDDSGLEPYVYNKVIHPAKDVIVDFGNGTKRNLVVYDDGIFIEVAELMQDLTNKLQGKVKFKREKVKNLSKLKEMIIINCTGLGARELLNDNHLIPVQGHLIMLKNQNEEKINYIISVNLGKYKNKNGFEVKRKCSFYPKRNIDSVEGEIGMLGGSFIMEANENMPNFEEFQVILENAKQFYGFTKAEVLSAN